MGDFLKQILVLLVVIQIFTILMELPAKFHQTVEMEGKRLGITLIKMICPNDLLAQLKGHLTCPMDPYQISFFKFIYHGFCNIYSLNLIMILSVAIYNIVQGFEQSLTVLPKSWAKATGGDSSLKRLSSGSIW